MGELHYFLGIEVTHTNFGGLHLSQSKYIQDLLVKASMQGCKHCKTPLPSSLKLKASCSPPFEDPSLYRSMVGSLQYITITRPELAYGVNCVCQFMQHPLQDHWKVVKRILRYLSGSSQFGLHIQQSNTLCLTGYSDSDWGGDPDDRKSTSGLCVYFGPNLITWSSKKQHVVTQSRTEVEYRRLAFLVAELIWVRNLLTEIQVPLQVTPMIYCDNLSVVLLAVNPILHSKSKHFELDLHFV